MISSASLIQALRSTSFSFPLSIFFFPPPIHDLTGTPVFKNAEGILPLFINIGKTKEKHRNSRSHYGILVAPYKAEPRVLSERSVASLHERI